MRSPRRLLAVTLGRSRWQVLVLVAGTALATVLLARVRGQVLKHQPLRHRADAPVANATAAATGVRAAKAAATAAKESGVRAAKAAARPVAAAVKAAASTGAAAATAAAEAQAQLATAALAVARPRSLLFVLARYEEDIRWVDEMPAAIHSAPHVKLVIYQTPGDEVIWRPPADALVAAQGAPSEMRVDGRWYSKHWPVRRTPMNRGHEAMAYVTAIIDHWANLPDTLVMMHAHRWSAHTHLNADWIIRRMAAHPPANVTGGFAGLQCEETPIEWDFLPLSNASAYVEWLERKGMDEIDLAGAWHEHFQRFLGALPAGLHAPPNAEFAVTAAAVRRLPLAFYQATQGWLMGTEQESFRAAIALEYLWGLIFTGQAVVQVPQARCMCELYNVCLPDDG